MTLRTLVVGPLEANCYIVGAETSREALIIDPGGDAPRILAALEDADLDIRYIFNTHGHVDHVAANAEVKEATGAELIIHEADREMIEKPHSFWSSLVGGVEPSSPDLTMADGDEFTVGEMTVQVIHTPGHSPGCVCLRIGDAIFTGDTLFASSIGRTDLPGGSMAQLQQSLRRLRDEVPAEAAVYPGHRGPSTMATELRENPYMQQL